MYKRDNLIQRFGYTVDARAGEPVRYIDSDRDLQLQKESPEQIPWGRVRQPTPVFLPGESHGQRSLVGYVPSGCKESVMTEAT